MTLKSYPNPDLRKSWVISIDATEGINILLRFIPDKLIIDHAAAKEYLRSQIQKTWLTPEDMLLMIIEDINNELIPKWIEVTYTFENVIICIEDKQPS